MSEQDNLSSIESEGISIAKETPEPASLPLGSALGLETALEYARHILTLTDPAEMKQAAAVVITQLEQLLKEYEEPHNPAHAPIEAHFIAIPFPVKRDSRS